MIDFSEGRTINQGKQPGTVAGFLKGIFCGIQLLFVVNCYGNHVVTNNMILEFIKLYQLSEPYNSQRDTIKVEVKRKKFLLLDSRIIESTKNARLEVGTVNKYPGNPLFIEDKAWEKRFDNLYGNVIFDKEEEFYKCWYSPFIIDTSAQGMTIEQRSKPYPRVPGREMAICYATSADGITWEKPVLRLVEYEGNKQNNIIWRGIHGAGIFKDLNDPDPARRYKTIFQGLFVSFSEDGINWTQKKHIENVNVRGDTHNNAFWAPTLGKYVGITRTFGDIGREVARIESSDFINWTKEEVVLTGENEKLQTYSMPVFFYGGVYIGLVAIYNYRNEQGGRVWTELAWSPDTKHWKRISPGTPLIPCSDIKLTYDYGCVYACANPIFLKDEIRLYYGGSDWLHSSWRNGSLCLASLRPDGFAGYVQESANKKAVVTTTPIPYEGENIRINADVETGGYVKITIIDDKGKLIPSKKDILKTCTEEKVKFVRKINPGNIQLLFEFKNAKLYSFSLDR